MPLALPRSLAFQDDIISTMDISRTQVVSLFATGGYGTAAATYSTANLAMYFPLWLSEATVVRNAYLQIATPSGNFDLGIYDASFARMVSTGSTAATVTGGTQIVDITDTTLDRGYYWLAIACNNTTISIRRTVPGSPYTRLLGFMMQTSAFPLPATATPVATNQATMGMFGFATRATV